MSSSTSYEIRAVLRHDASGLFYTCKGPAPHVDRPAACRFPSAAAAERAKAALDTAGRGSYSVEAA